MTVRGFYLLENFQDFPKLYQTFQDLQRFLETLTFWEAFQSSIRHEFHDRHGSHDSHDIHDSYDINDSHDINDLMKGKRKGKSANKCVLMRTNHTY